jgi:hypothetical protein
MRNRWMATGLFGAGVVTAVRTAERVEITTAGLDIANRYVLVACKQ